jgi:hypothetical protein
LVFDPSPDGLERADSVYGEGIAYSGRLPSHQYCAGIILTPPIDYLMHTTHLMHPVFSSSVLRPLAKAEANPRWPESFSPSQENIVFVDPGWKDLETKVMWLRDHPKIAEGIARRQGEIVNKGYVSEASEVCYLRSLGWCCEFGRWEVDGGGRRTWGRNQV